MCWECPIMVTFDIWKCSQVGNLVSVINNRATSWHDGGHYRISACKIHCRRHVLVRTYNQHLHWFAQSTCTFLLSLFVVSFFISLSVSTIFVTCKRSKLTSLFHFPKIDHSYIFKAAIANQQHTTKSLCFSCYWTTLLAVKISLHIWCFVAGLLLELNAKMRLWW